jgi:CRISPR type IV-associated protein Csf2
MSAFHLKGFVKTVTPLVQTPMQEGNSGTDTEITRLNVLRDLDTISPKKDGSMPRMVVSVPIYSGNGFRGLFRRITSSIIFDHFLEQDQFIPMHIGDWFRAGSGRSSFAVVDLAEKPEGFNTQFAKVLPRDLEYYQQNTNIHSGIFGGGLVCRGNLSVSDLIAVCEESRPILPHFSLPETLPNCYSLIGKKFWSRTSLNKYNDELKWYSEEEVDAYFEKLNALAEAKAESKKNKDDTDTKTERLSVQMIGRYEYIVPNTPLAFQMRLKNASAAQIGLIVRGFEKFAENPQLGALNRWYFGMVRMNLQDPENPQRKITIDPSFGIECQGFDEEKAAFDEWLANVTMDDLDIAKTLCKEDKKKKGKK